MNHLKNASSKYLLQHVNNPVDWYSWGEEPFEKAKKENKPVLVSIGYASCHWCHVMEHESFEDPLVADLMNREFVCIKVDKEEHPDVDNFYMDALQSLTGSGGWPLNMFATPDKKPFYGGTYFPPMNMENRLSWTEVLRAVARAWKENKNDLLEQSSRMMSHLQDSLKAGMHGAYADLNEEAVETICRNLLANADTAWGGFGGAPKFPASFSVRFLLEYYRIQKNRGPVSQLAERALLHAELTLDRMISGGIYDQVGGGFFRYSTDEFWHIPHYEKMLYDNALMITLLAVAYKVSKKNRYKRALKETVEFCNRALKHPELPGFFSSLDADQNGSEGGFYLWTKKEWKEALNVPNDAATAYFGMQEDKDGALAHPLFCMKKDEEIFKDYGLNEKAWDNILHLAKEKLRSFRNKRKLPEIDDKIILSWNALMNKALQDAGEILEDEGYLEQAKEHLLWMEKTFKSEAGQWFRVNVKDKVYIDAKLDDYAFLTRTMIQYASISGENNYLLKAKELLQETIELFKTEDRPFFYYSSKEQNDIPVKKVEIYDGAQPSVNAVMAENLFVLGACFGELKWREQYQEMVKGMEETVKRFARSFAYWGILILREAYVPKQVVITGVRENEKLREWRKHYFPEVFVWRCENEKEDVLLLQEKYKKDEPFKAFLCFHSQCLSPFFSFEELNKEIKKIR